MSAVPSSIKEIKAALNALGLDYTGLTEKSELVSLLQQHQPPSAARPKDGPKDTPFEAEILKRLSAATLSEMCAQHHNEAFFPFLCVACECAPPPLQEQIIC